MAYTYQTPETVQRSAEDYLNLEKEQNAFDLLVNYMTGKKPRQWSNALEKIMFMLIDLALKFNKKSVLREPFNSYRFASQNSNMGSFEQVLLYFAKAAEEKFEKLIATPSQEVLEMEDLDMEEPDDLFINSLDVKAKTEKQIVRNALKVIWETYKMILETTNKNKKLEDLYSTILHKTLEFCKKYNRRAELKRLCESIRSNLNGILKTMAITSDLSKIPFAIDLSNTETNEKQMLIRFDILEYADHFHLWQESLKILDDVHHIMEKRRAPMKPKILSDYFENLAKMFWKSEFYLYHAVAYFNHFTLLRTKNKNIKNEDLVTKSCAFVLSVLSIPQILNENHLSEDAKSKTISLLSSEAAVPSKQELVAYIVKHNILELCTEPVRELFYLIEDSKNMVNLTKNSEPLLKVICKDYPRFHLPLQDVIVYKLLSLLSKLYTKLKLDNLYRFLGDFDYSVCERIIHSASISDNIKVRIDHKRKLLLFQDDVQDMQSLSLRFVNFSEDLKEVVHSIDNKKEEAREQKVIDQLRDEARKFNESGRTALSKRLKMIEDMRKPDVPRSRPAQEERTRPEPTTVKPQDKEALERAAADKKKKVRIEDALAQLNRTRKEQLIKTLRGIKGFKLENRKIEDFTDDDLNAIPLDKLDKAKEDWDRREKDKEEAAIRNAFKRADYMERAKREEYINVLKKKWDESQGEKEEIMKIHKESFEKMIEFKKKIREAQKFRDTHVEKVLNDRDEVFQEEMQEFREKIIEEFREKLLTRAKESLKAQRDAEEEERKRREDDLLKERKRLDDEREKQGKIEPAKPSFSRNTVTAEDMRKQQAPSTTTTSGGLARRTVEEEKQDGGLKRNTAFKPAASEPESTGPKKFINPKKTNPFGDAKPVEPQPAETTTATTTATTTDTKETPAPVANDGWRAAPSTTKKTEESGGWRNAAGSGSGSGFQKGPGTASNTGASGPPKFFKGEKTNTSTTSTSNTTSGTNQSSGGWRNTK